MSELYLRNVKLTAGKGKFSNQTLTIRFKVPFDDGPDINIAEVEIYNLSDSTVAALKKGDKVVLDAGYQDDIGMILQGVNQSVYTYWSGVDRITELLVADAHDDWMKKRVSKTYKENITGLQVLNDLIPMTGLKIGALKLPLNMKYTGAKTVDDIVGKLIVEVARDCNAKVHVNKGKIFIRAKSEGDKIAFVLDKNHGLIGSPTPIESEEKYNVVQKKKVMKTVKPKKAPKPPKVPKGQPKPPKPPKAKPVKVATYVDEYVEKTRIRKGYKVKSLLNYNFATDVIIKIDSKTAKGYFRIEKGQHDGSSFYTEMEVFPV